MRSTKRAKFGARETAIAVLPALHPLDRERLLFCGLGLSQDDKDRIKQVISELKDASAPDAGDALVEGDEEEDDDDEAPEVQAPSPAAPPAGPPTAQSGAARWRRRR